MNCFAHAINILEVFYDTVRKSSVMDAEAAIVKLEPAYFEGAVSCSYWLENVQIALVAEIEGNQEAFHVFSSSIFT